MKKVTYVLIPGLWDQKPLFGWFYYMVARWWSWLGMSTTVCDMKWVSTEPYKVKRVRLQHCIEAERHKGRGVVLVGVSAGGPMAIIGLAEEDAVAAAVTINGILKLNKDDRDNALYAATSWFEATDRGERAAARLNSKLRASLLAISGSKDDIIINTSKEHIAGATNKKIAGKGHLSTIVKILLWYPFVIRRFVRRVTSKD